MKTIRTSFAGMLLCAAVTTVLAEPGSQGSATLAWNRVALETIERAKPTQHQTVRLLAHLSLAQYAAIVQAPHSESAASVVGSASQRVIAGLFPMQAEYVAQQARAIGIEDSAFGQRIGDRILVHAGDDGFARPWAGRLPAAPGAWTSLAVPPAPPAYPGIGGMRTFVIDRGNAFRPGEPPALDSARFDADLDELRRITREPSEEAKHLARFYDMTTGTMAGGYWNEEAAKSIRRSGFDERRAAIVLATLNTAMMDALVACHDAKYAYWVPRPSQVDPSIRPIIGVPNHPSYPSNHSCLSTAAGRVLAHFFPADASRFARTASDAGRSRILAGIHYRFDVEAGETIGEQVAAAAIARHTEMLARLTGTVVGDSRR